MPTFNLGDYGVLGGVILLFIIIFWKGPEIIIAFKGQARTTTTEVSNSNNANSSSNNLVLQELTVAITKLTVFLETEKAVDKEKEQTLSKNIDEIIRIGNITQHMLSDHCLKCDMFCHKENSN